MKVNRYKQYCWYRNKLISALKRFTTDDYDDPFSGETFYDRTNYRPMKISVHDSEGNLCRSLEEIHFDIDDYPEDIVIAQNYVKAVFGELQDWTPATIEISTESISVWIVRFPSDSRMVDYDIIYIDHIPKDVYFQIDIEAVDGFEAESYMIHSEPNSTDEGSEYHLVIKEYKGSVLQRICEMGHNKQGTFELITDAE